jgi:hypothetical protein
MKLAVKILIGYGAFAVANMAIASARKAGQLTAVPAALLDFNDSLTRLNVLSMFSSAGTAAAPSTVQAPFTPLPAPVVTDTAGGTTTYYG